MCPNKDQIKINKYKGQKDLKSYKSYKEKGKKSCYIVKDSDSEEDEMVYIFIRDDSNNEENEKTTLISNIIKNDTWIIDSGCSHHMTSDKKKFQYLEHYDGGSVRFDNKDPYYIREK